MNKLTSPTRIARQALVSALSVSLALGPVTQPAYAALTALADIPIASKVTAHPNIIYTVDDSGSMGMNYLPDYVHLNGIFKYMRTGSGASDPFAVGVNPTYPAQWMWYPPLNAAGFNHLAYDPNITYQPPLKADGTPLTNNIGTVTDAAGNQINFAKVQTDPFLTPASTVDLTVVVAVPLYCNSDWPNDTLLHPIASDYRNDSGGADCRINGTNYASAPAVSENYNYPWQNTVAPNGAQYFWRNNFTKSLWCDKNAAGWPQTCAAGPQTCAGIITVPPTVPQTCYLQSTPTGCVGPTTYAPAGCNTSALYCSPGLGVLPECISGCVGSCPIGPTGRNGACHTIGPAPGSGGTGAACNCAGAGCILPACAAYQPPSTCSTGWVAGPPVCGPAASANCTSLKGAGPTTLLQDAELLNGGTGSVCRHNNFAGYGAGLFTYSAAAATFKTAVTGGCPTVGSTVNIPRHYYTVDSVDFCSATIGTNNVQWKGFGTLPCQPKNDLTTFVNVKYGQFHRRDLVASNAPFSYTDLVTGAALSRNLVQEQVNYANWYAYYRTRILALKTTSSIAFSFLDNSYRVGFHNLGNEPPPNGPGTPIIFVNPSDFNLAQKTAWYNALYNISITNYKTPTLSALLRIGNLFENGSAAGVPGTVNPLPGAAVDPITLTCQNNYHILFTDGVTQQIALPAVAGNQDANVPVWGATIVDNPPDQVLPTLRPLTGSPWIKPFKEGGIKADTLSDIAMYYWARDLRPAMKNDVPSSTGKQPADYCADPVGSPCPPTPLVHPMAGDADWKKDVAWWQHVSLSAISFGAEGVLDATNSKATVQTIHDTALNWPVAAPPNNPVGVGTAIDDLWHATANSRGAFVYARSPIEVSYGLASILAGIQNQRKSRVDASFPSQILDASNNIIYEATIESGWAGDLLKVQIDPTDATEITTLWQASTSLTNQLKPSVPNPEPWFNAANQANGRRVVTINDSSGAPVPFRYASLSAAQLATLSPNPVTQQKIIAYLRGASVVNPPLVAATTTIEGTGIGQFRQRFGPLGDITNGKPVVVPAPVSPPLYDEGTNLGYTAFVTAHAARSTRIYAPANDGMLHSFDAADGHEVFAFVPKALMRNAVDSSGKPTGIQALTYQDGGIPIYKHHFYVDSAPRMADVDFGGSDWHTIVVGGLGKGGNSYYALDVTSADAVDETDAAAKVLWEFHDADMVYTYGRPVIGKTRAYGWVVVVTAGYNNVSGLGKIFFIDPKTGTLLKTMSTGFGNGGSPSGLAQINGFTKWAPNQIMEQIYGGDLYGNFWRFDVSDPNPGAWTVVKFATVVDAAGTAQPITTAPQIEIDFNNSIDRYVFIGTGQLLDQSDLTTPAPAQQQTMYAFRDGTITTPNSVGLPISTDRMATPLKPLPADGISSIAGGAPNGWYHDLPTGLNAERIVVDVEADLNTVTYIGTQVQNDPCIIALPATIYAHEYVTGRSLLSNGGGAPIASLVAPKGAVGIQIVAMTDLLGQQTLGALIGGEIPGTSPVKLLNPKTGGANRFSWRMLGGL